MVDLGENIKRLRLGFGETQEEIGEVIGVSKQVIYSYEKNRTQPDKLALAAICNHFMISVDELLTCEIPKVEVFVADPKYVFSKIDVFFPMLEVDRCMNESMKKAEVLRNAIFSELRILDLSHLNLICECLEAYENAFLDEKCRVYAAANYVGMWSLLLIALKIVPVSMKDIPLFVTIDTGEGKMRPFTEEMYGEEAAGVYRSLRERKKDVFYDECLSYIRGIGSLSDLGYFYLASSYLWGTVENEHSINVNRRLGREMMRSYAKIGNPYAMAFLGIKQDMKKKKRAKKRKK